MKEKVQKILEILFWTVLTGGMLALVGFTVSSHGEKTCKKYTISIDYGKADTLITREDVTGLIRKTGYVLQGQRLGLIDFNKIETAIRRQPYVADAQVYATLEGEIGITVRQRQPILRVFNQSGESFYLDGSGVVLPLNPAFSARVLVASGFIDEPFSRQVNYSCDSVRLRDSLQFRGVMNNLFRLACHIIRYPFLKAQIEQVYVDRNGEMELIPRVGNHIILLGNADDLDDKFTRLMVFYTLGLSRTGWDKYQIINIKYQRQVVCSKI